MDTIIVLCLIVIIFLILSMRNRAVERINKLEEEIRRLGDQLNRFSSGTATKESITATKEPAVAVKEPAAAIKEKDVKKEEGGESSAERWRRPEAPIIRTQVLTPPLPAPPPPLETAPRPAFFERHPDLEKFIGENLTSKIGIAILVLAIGFFVKYAIDNDWIGPIGRVGIGLLCGSILIGLAHRLRNSYPSFSSVLVGGGLAVFYFSIALAFHPYQLFNQLTAFLIMLVITAFAVLLSLLYDRQELAIIALAGGFVSPFIASNGSGDYRSLFIYLLILNTGLLVISYHKAWRLLNVLAFIFTGLLVGSWLFTLADNVPLSTYRNGFLFATLFYLLFFAINIAHTIRENKKFIASDFGILLANTCLYFGGGLYLLTQMGAAHYLGAFSASMGLFNLGTSYFLFRQKKVDSNILYLLIGITLSFISLTAPIQLHGHYITLFWATESVLLYWLFTKSGIKIMGWACLLIWTAMLTSLLMDWSVIYNNPTSRLPVLVNKGFITGVFATLSCFLLAWLKKKEEAEEAIHRRVGKNVVFITGSALLFLSGALETHHQFIYYYPDSELYILYLLLYTFGFVFLFTGLAGRPGMILTRSYTLLLLSASVMIELAFTKGIFDIQRPMLESHRYLPHFMAHWTGALLILFLLYKLIRLVSDEKNLPADRRGIATWLLCMATISILSIEGHIGANALFYSKAHSLEEIQRVYIKTGLPILWGLCSLGFMWLGMHYNFRPLRIISLALFSITLVKLFLFDISNIPIAGKIAAFFCLGILLLVVSFMYQRLKKILIEDEAKKNS